MATPVITPFGLQPASLDYLTAPGQAGPQLRAVAAQDENTYSAGDLVVETGAALAGVPVVTSALLQVADGLSRQPHGGIYARTPSVVVAIAPGSPWAQGPQPVLAAGAKGIAQFLWVLKPGMREFFVAGDASAPARGEFVPDGAPRLSLPAEGIEGAGLFASLLYGPPAGGVSGTALAGDSFSFDASSCLAVVRLEPGMPLTARSLWRVRVVNGE